MKEIGERLREAREEMGVSKEEAAEDLKLKVSQIEDLEDGNIEPFKDVFDLKYLIRDYAKYLGLDYNDLVDEFNEFLFDYTSKISLKDIKEAQKKEPQKEEKHIASPYTVSKDKKPLLQLKLIYLILLFVVILVAVYFLVIRKENDKLTPANIEVANKEDLYEFTY